MDLTFSLEELPEIAKRILSSNPKHKTLLFYGEMGSGKTTLIKELLKQLGVKNFAGSPTFSLVNEYLSNNEEIIYHFDFYRIKDEEEALDIGIEEYFYNNTWCFVEWPSIVENLLPLETIKLYLTKDKNKNRRIQISE